MPGQQHDVVVVGAGIIGLACAWALARDGARTLVIDRGLPGAEQSVRTGGGIRLAHASSLNVELARLSIPIWERFVALTGYDPRFTRIGHLFLARENASASALRDQVRLHERLGVTSDLLDGDDVNRRWDLDLRGFEAGLWNRDGGYLDHHRVIQGLYHAAVEAGAEVLTGVRVTGMVKVGARVVGVQTTEGHVRARSVVNAAGALAGQVAALAGHELPIIARRHALLIVQPDRPVPDSLPWLIDVDRQAHLRPEGQGRALVGGFLGEDAEVDPERYDPRYDEDWAVNVRRVTAEAFGITEPGAPIVQGWAGLYAGTPDYHPVIEESCPGLLTAAGFSGTGLMHAPAAGQLIAELASGDRPTSLDITGLRSSRFGDPIGPRDHSGF